MKKVLALSVLAASVAFAGGNIPAPVVEEPAVAPAPAPSASPWYVGLLAGLAYDKNMGAANGDVKIPTATLAVGYDLLDWLALEGRVSKGLKKKTDSAVEVQNKLGYGAYLKPHVALTDALDLNAYLGVAKNKREATEGGVTTSTSKSGFSYGAGLGYALTDAVDVVVDYMKFKKNGDEKFHNIDLGFTYHY
jgi:opacity protein-like surface antigen